MNDPDIGDVVVRGRERQRRGQILAIAVAVAIIGIVFAYLLPRIADYSKVWAVVRALPARWILALIGVTILNILSYAPPWMAALPGLGFFNALRVALGPSAVSIVTPGAGAVSVATQFAMLRSWGLDRRSAALAAAATNVWGQLAAYSFPVIAILALSVEGAQDHTLTLVALIALAVIAALIGAFTASLWSEHLARRTGDSAGRGVSWLKGLFNAKAVQWGGDDFVHFRREAIELLRRRWHLLTIATLMSQLTVFGVLVVCLRAVGITHFQVSLVEAFAAWSIIRTLGKIPVTPAGFGVEEIALIGALIGFGAKNAPAVSATLLYRFLTVVPALVLGLAVAATYRVRRPQLARSTHS